MPVAAPLQRDTLARVVFLHFLPRFISASFGLPHERLDRDSRLLFTSGLWYSRKATLLLAFLSRTVPLDTLRGFASRTPTIFSPPFWSRSKSFPPRACLDGPIAEVVLAASGSPSGFPPRATFSRIPGWKRLIVFQHNKIPLTPSMSWRSILVVLPEMRNSLASSGAFYGTISRKQCDLLILPLLFHGTASSIRSHTLQFMRRMAWAISRFFFPARLFLDMDSQRCLSPQDS